MENIIDEKFTWDLTPLCKDLSDFEKRLDKVAKEMKKIKNFEGKIKDGNAEEIFRCFEFREKIDQELTMLGVYISCKHDEDITNSKINALCAKLGNVSTEYSALGDFISVDLSNLSNKFLLELSKDKNHKQYKLNFINIIKAKKHILSLKEENLLSKMGNFAGGFSEVFRQIDDADMVFDDVKDSKGKLHPLTNATYAEYLESDDTVLRRNTFAEMHNKFGKLNNTISALYVNNIIETDFYAKIRNFESCLKMALEASNIDESVYNNLIKKTNDYLKYQYQYYETKRKVLGLDKLHVADAYAPTSKALNKKFSYDECFEILNNTFGILGEDYVKLFNKAKNERWIDVYPKKNKRSGAYQTDAYGVHPYVLTNYTGTLDGVYTLAHELGHAFHTYFSSQNQPYNNAGYGIFLAEIASTTNEILLTMNFLKNAKTNEEKMFFYDKFLSNVTSTIYRQTMFAEFEQFAHEHYEKEHSLTKDDLNDKYFELSKKYYGKDMEVPENIKYSWSRIPHFYSDFYVYKYATGMLSAILIAKKIINKEENAVQNYIKFLSSGSSKYPLDTLKLVGVDLTKPETFDVAYEFIGKMAKQYQNLVDKKLSKNISK